MSVQCKVEKEDDEAVITERCSVVSMQHQSNDAETQHGKPAMETIGSIQSEVIHAVDKSYYCTQCGKQFTRCSSLKKHGLAFHDIKPYSCIHCGKQFAECSKFKAHEMTHAGLAGVKRYSCIHCVKEFTTSGDLRKHERTHTGVKPYSCNQCGKQFTLRHHLRRHEVTHTGVRPVSCIQCGKQFVQICDLKRHERTHAGIKPYSCDQCDKQFAQLGQLQRHNRSHTGVKPYSCMQCGKQYADRRRLLYHFSSVHCGEHFTRRRSSKKREQTPSADTVKMNEDEDPASKKRRLATERVRKWRAKQTEEWRAKIRATDAQAYQQRINQMTPEQLAEHNAAHAASQQRYVERMTVQLTSFDAADLIRLPHTPTVVAPTAFYQDDVADCNGTPGNIASLPMEILESLLMRSYMKLFVSDFRSGVYSHAEQMAYMTLASVCSDWRQTLSGWSQSTKHWMRRKLQRLVKSELAESDQSMQNSSPKPLVCGFVCGRCGIVFDTEEASVYHFHNTCKLR